MYIIVKNSLYKWLSSAVHRRFNVIILENTYVLTDTEKHNPCSESPVTHCT